MESQSISQDTFKNNMQQTRAAYAVDYSELEDAERDGSDQDGDGERFNREESENPNLQGMGTVKGTAERKHDKQANDLALVPYGEYGKTRSAYHNKNDVKMAENLTVERLAERARETTERESEREEGWSSIQSKPESEKQERFEKCPQTKIQASFLS
ncbi:hypothetical protein LY78DRAFT_302431 [Colletotrichum sublineola]|nr:hypothetical protein LY78DRAFT_302431 [Colletotrichum sublineola]